MGGGGTIGITIGVPARLAGDPVQLGRGAGVPSDRQFVGGYPLTERQR